MYLKFIVFIFWWLVLTIFIVIFLKSLWEGNVSYIRISLVCAVVSLCTIMAIYKDY